jgi:hypothetical protein
MLVLPGTGYKDAFFAHMPSPVGRRCAAILIVAPVRAFVNRPYTSRRQLTGQMI